MAANFKTSSFEEDTDLQHIVMLQQASGIVLLLNERCLFGRTRLLENAKINLGNVIWVVLASVLLFTPPHARS